jgi:hypothetical protein
MNCNSPLHIISTSLYFSRFLYSDTSVLSPVLQSLTSSDIQPPSIYGTYYELLCEGTFLCLLRHFAFACRDSYQVEYTLFRMERRQAGGQSAHEE